MSEEEIINTVIAIKNHQIAVFEPKERIHIWKNYFTEEQRNAIQGLLDLYKAEKEKNKKIEDKIKEIIDKIDVEDYYCLNEAEEDLRKLVE